MTTEVSLSLYRLSDGKAFVVPVSTIRDINCFAIEPGSYSVSSCTVTRTWMDGGRTWGSWKDGHTLGYRLLIEPQTVYLYPALFEYVDRGDTNNNYDLNFWKTLGDLERTKALDAIKKDSHWRAWEGYAMVNFPEE